MNKLNSMMAVALFALTFTACKKDEKEPEIVVPISDGSTLTLNGLISTELGSAAGNSVYVDFSADKQNSVARDSWDLGFYSGTDFKVILNSTNGASALLVNKIDLNAVTVADFDPNSLKVGQGQGNFTIVDDGREKNILNKTAIATVSATDSENKVYIINRKGGSATVLANDELYKIRVIRKGTTGYTLQYAKVTETTFKTIDITKDTKANFQFTSLVRGAATTVEPAKADWDIVWGYSMYFTGTFPYGFSDLVFINSLGGITAAQVSTTTKAYAAFAESDIASLTFLSDRDVIGSKWRTSPDQTGAGGGVKTDLFYVVKDASGNVYKLKFVSYISADGGTRGKPVVEYKLIKKG